MIAHLRHVSEWTEPLHCCYLFSEDPEGEKWVHCAVCSTWAHTLCAVAKQGNLCLSIAIQNNKK
jgi:hypothetical protein